MRRREYYEEQKMKKLVLIFAIALIMALILFVTIFVLYNKKVKQKENSEKILSLKEISDIVPNDEKTEITSSSKDLTIEEAKKNTINNKISENTVSRNIVNTTPIPAIVNNSVEEKKVEKKYVFKAPVSGEIIKDYAIDSLIYSNTLEEWTTHTGIDIKAAKTTIVCAAESGIVESIKNDPRYGLSIIIKHGDEFKTVYSNLLTTEFVKEGEEVEKGQTIGTIGDTASFEIVEEPHLHFEIYKNGQNVNPTIYLKDN